MSWKVCFPISELKAIAGKIVLIYLKKEERTLSQIIEKQESELELALLIQEHLWAKQPRPSGVDIRLTVTATLFWNHPSSSDSDSVYTV